MGVFSRIFAVSLGGSKRAGGAAAGVGGAGESSRSFLAAPSMRRRGLIGDVTGTLADAALREKPRDRRVVLHEREERGDYVRLAFSLYSHKGRWMTAAARRARAPGAAQSISITARMGAVPSCVSRRIRTTCPWGIVRS